MTFRQNHCCTLRSLLTSHKMFTAISPPTVNVSNFSKTAASQNRKKTIKSPLLLSSPLSVRSAPSRKPVQVHGGSVNPLLLRRCCPGCVRLVLSPAEPGPLLCRAGWLSAPGLRPGEGRAGGSARGGCDERWSEFCRGCLYDYFVFIIKESDSFLWLLV